MNGYRCSECGRYQKYPGYVYAHWTIKVAHTCECGKVVSILEGEATPVEPEDELKRIQK